MFKISDIYLDLLSEAPWGLWANKPGFIPKVANQLSKSGKHCFGGNPSNYPLCNCCKNTMRIFATLDFSDEILRTTLGAPAHYKGLILPYCPDCDSTTGLNLFKLNPDGMGVKIVCQSAEPSPNRFRPVLPDFNAIPLRLTKLTEEMMPVTNELYDKNIENWAATRTQIGGAPLYASFAEGLKSPISNKPMQFVASIAENIELMDRIGIDNLGIGAVIYFFIDWENGFLGSLYQQ